MAPTYIVAFATLVAAVLSRQGVVIATDDLITTFTTLVTVAGPILVMLRQYLTGRATILGTRPQE